ncbi:hypothetical protein L6452_40140 [Arctium lappa]|uniref:Uncharacterized protein n=1 Tax=Arctium lappa TaxID=4217 RepID=A0ACB8XLG2_ARCLA|nr:hypothetical protein L6452_40140 [Arctium lappa]
MVSSSSNPIHATPINQSPPENHPEPPPSPLKPTKRFTRSQAKFQTRTMTADEGSTIVISDDTGSRSVGSKPKNTYNESSPMKKKREHNLLDTLAEAAELRASEDTPPVSPILQSQGLLNHSLVQSREGPPSPHEDQVVEDTPTVSSSLSPLQANKAKSHNVAGIESFSMAVNSISSFPEYPQASVGLN